MLVTLSTKRHCVSSDFMSLFVSGMGGRVRVRVRVRV
jgi:hypothetical protein